MTGQPNDVIKVTAVFIGPSLQEMNNVFWYKYRDGPSLDDASYMAAVGGYLDEMYDLINQDIVDDLTYDQIRFYNITQDYPMGTIGWPTLTTGTSLGDPLPAGNAALVVGYTAVKRTYGKKFIPGYAEAGAAGDTWNAGVFTRLGTWAGAWYTSIPHTGGGLSHSGVWKRDALPDPYFADFVSMNAREIVAYQRRRKPGVGA